MNDDNDANGYEEYTLDTILSYTKDLVDEEFEVTMQDAPRPTRKPTKPRKPAGLSIPLTAEERRLYTERARSQGLSLKNWIKLSLEWIVDS